MRGERVKIKNVKEIKDRLKAEKEGNTKVRLIFLNLIAYEGVNFKKACKCCGIVGRLSRKLCLNMIVICLKSCCKFCIQYIGDRSYFVSWFSPFAKMKLFDQYTKL